MLQKHSYVQEENESLVKEIQLLAEAANTAQDFSINKMAIIISVIVSAAVLLAEQILEHFIFP